MEERDLSGNRHISTERKPHREIHRFDRFFVKEYENIIIHYMRLIRQIFSEKILLGKLLYFSKFNGKLVLVQDFVNGLDLETLTHGNVKISDEIIDNIQIEILKTINKINSVGFSHTDVKPANFMLYLSEVDFDEVEEMFLEDEEILDLWENKDIYKIISIVTKDRIIIFKELEKNQKLLSREEFFEKLLEFLDITLEKEEFFLKLLEYLKECQFLDPKYVAYIDNEYVSLTSSEIGEEGKILQTKDYGTKRYSPKISEICNNKGLCLDKFQLFQTISYIKQGKRDEKYETLSDVEDCYKNEDIPDFIDKRNKNYCPQGWGSCIRINEFLLSESVEESLAKSISYFIIFSLYGCFNMSEEYEFYRKIQDKNPRTIEKLNKILTEKTWWEHIL